MGGLGSDRGTVPFASEVLKGAILWPAKAFWLIVETGILWVPELDVDEAGLCVGGLGPAGGTGPLGSELLKGAILWPPKAFWPIVEAGWWVGGLGPDGGTGPLGSEPCKEATL